MISTRSIGKAPRVESLAGELPRIGPCIGCKDCRGLCAALIEALTLPVAVLREAP